MCVAHRRHDVSVSQHCMLSTTGCDCTPPSSISAVRRPTTRLEGLQRPACHADAAMIVVVFLVSFEETLSLEVSSTTGQSFAF
jgi:hypothetical protein